MIAKAAKSKKADGILILDVRKISTFCDYFVICDATSGVRIGAISKNIKETLEKQGIRIRHTEGAPETRWVLLDCGDVVVHIFDKETRNFYGLERLWGDAPVIPMTARKTKNGRKKKKTKTGKK